MHRQRYFLFSFVFALVAFLAALGLGSAISSSRSESDESPAPAPVRSEQMVRSEDRGFALLLVSPVSPFLFGRQRVEVAAYTPAGDRVRTIDFFIDGRLEFTASRPPYAFIFDFGEAIRSHTIRVVGTTEQDRLARLSFISRWASPPSRVEVNLVTLPVAVLDDRGRFVEGLKMSDFSLLEDDEPQSIVHFDSEPTPVSLVVALDASESMQGTLWSARKAAQDFIESLPSFYKVSVLGFSDSVVLTRDFTHDRRQLALALNSLKPAGKTGLYDALRDGAERLRDRGDRRIAILFTDGGETVYENEEEGATRLEAALEMARKSGVTFYTIGFGPEAALGLLCRISEQTGGQCYDSRNPRALSEIYARIGEELNHQYSISYYPTRPFEEGGWRNLTVRVHDPKLTVRARPGYLAGHSGSPVEPGTAPAPRKPAPASSLAGPSVPSPAPAAGEERVSPLTNEAPVDPSESPAEEPAVGGEPPSNDEPAEADPPNREEPSPEDE